MTQDAHELFREAHRLFEPPNEVAAFFGKLAVTLFALSQRLFGGRALDDVRGLSCQQIQTLKRLLVRSMW